MNLRHKKNLYRHMLACFKHRRAFQKKFKIESYCARGTQRLLIQDAVNVINECGTTACFAGLTLLTGFKIEKCETWNSFVQRVFGLFEFGDTADEWAFLFSMQHDNNLMAAIRRAAYYLDKGLPEVGGIGFNKTENYRILEVPDYKIAWKKLAAIYGD